MNKDKFFTEHYEEFCIMVDKRRLKWRAVSIMEFDDVRSILLTRIYQQLHLYDETKPLDRWANTLISNAIKNILRDRLYRDSRPCISGRAPGFNMGSSYGRGCACALGDGGCTWTKSGKQDVTCKFFAAWVAKKQLKHAISTPLSMENHVDETHSIQSDFVDFDSAKKIIDLKILPKLNKEEAKVYKLLYIKHLDEEEVGRRMGYKKQANSDIHGYLQIRAIKIKIKELTKQIIQDEDLV